MTPLVLYEFADDVDHAFPANFTIGKYIIYRSCDTTQTLSPLFVLECEAADLLSRGRIANFQLGKEQIFLRMMVHFRINFEIADNRANDLIVGTAVSCCIGPVRSAVLAISIPSIRWSSALSSSQSRA